jgi:DNA-binding MarR family transcriptional regulator
LIHYEHVILFILAKANQRVHGTFKSGLQHFGLTPMQALILHALFEEEGLSAGAIGRRLSLDSATLSGVLERMAEAGWIVKNVAEGDRRLLHIQLTPKAQACKDAFLKEVEGINGSILAGFRVEERLLLERMLKDLRG